MQTNYTSRKNRIEETIHGVVEIITFHSPESGYFVLKVKSLDLPNQQITVTTHHASIFPGATMEFQGHWDSHPIYGRQFKAVEATLEKPASAAAIEKYLSSGLIENVGPKRAWKIVKFFGTETLTILNEQPERLIEIPGIGKKISNAIVKSWDKHRMIQKVMTFLFDHGISTLFATRIYKEYGDRAIHIVSENPYILAKDFYGIGFTSADRVALSIGIGRDSPKRIKAAIYDILSSSHENGHCYLTESQIIEEVQIKIELDISDKIAELLRDLEKDGQLKVRNLNTSNEINSKCYYSKTLYYDENFVAQRIKTIGPTPLQLHEDIGKAPKLIEQICKGIAINLSEEQKNAIEGIVHNNFSILTGGPGCGKTTTLFVLVKLLEKMNLKVMLAAPTGRAAQRMTEIIGKKSKTIHRLLEWRWEGFKKNQDNQLKADFLIIDECSMLDISLTAALLKATPAKCQILFIGDPDQLPSMGAGNVLKDLISSGAVFCCRLKKIFRQAKKSMLVQYAHQINNGDYPPVKSPFEKPELFANKIDCLFIDSEVATMKQVNFINKVKKFFDTEIKGHNLSSIPDHNSFLTKFQNQTTIPEEFEHIDVIDILNAKSEVEELKAVLKTIHPFSSLCYNKTATDMIKHLYEKSIPNNFGKNCEIQLLSPMTKGTLGTVKLNMLIQNFLNPKREEKKQIIVGEKIFREGDRVIHCRNNYELGVFNGDIGRIREINVEEMTCKIYFPIDDKTVSYKQVDIFEIDLAYAITIHKSQGSEFDAVIIPLFTQHYKMLYRNLIYTALTRAKKLAVIVGGRNAFAMAIKNKSTSQRQTALKQLIR